MSTLASIGVVTLFLLSLSGGIYYGVPQIESSIVPNGVTSPKSDNSTFPSWFINKFYGLMSLKAKPRLCIYYNPFMTSHSIFFTIFNLLFF